MTGPNRIHSPPRGIRSGVSRKLRLPNSLFLILIHRSYEIDPYSGGGGVHDALTRNTIVRDIQVNPISVRFSKSTKKGR
jgi:hypothetical protein